MSTSSNTATQAQSKGSSTKDDAVADNVPTSGPSTPPIQKRSVLELVILCVGLFCPLFLATLDQSLHPSSTQLITSHCRNCSSTYSIVLRRTRRPVLDRQCIYFDKHSIYARLRTIGRYFRSTFSYAICGFHFPCRQRFMYWCSDMGHAISRPSNFWCRRYVSTPASIKFVAAGCLIMTRIIMSDHVTLKQNARQNGILLIMFAVAFSIGPVHLSNGRN